MNRSTVWSLCSIVAIAVMVFGFSNPSSAQQNARFAEVCDEIVRLEGGEAVNVGDSDLQIDAECRDFLTELLEVPASQQAAPTYQIIEGPQPTPSNLSPSLAQPQALSPLPQDGLARQYAVALANGQSIVLPNVLFESGSTQLPQAARNAIQAAVTAMSSVGGNYLVSGYASADGDRAKNIDLSWQRARTVGGLLSQSGYSASRILVVGMGPTTAFGPNPADNRQVTISLYSR